MKRKVENFKILDRDTCQTVFDKAVEILEEKGLSVYSSDIRDSLLKAGVKKGDGDIIKLSREIIQKAIDATPSEFDLYDLKGGYQKLKKGTILEWIMPYVESLKILRYDDRKLSPSTLNDLEKAVIVSESIDIVNISGIITWPLELSSDQQLNKALYTLLSNSQKTMAFGLQNVEQAKVILKAIKIVATHKDIKKNPSIIFVSSPISPMTVDKDSGDILMYGMDNGLIPVLASCPMAGGTSQFSVIGTVLQQVIEQLFMLVAKYSIDPEFPAIWGGAAAPMDMKAGDVSYGASERSLMMLANIDMANFFDIPANSPSASVDSCLLDVQLGAEKTWTYMTRVLSDAAMGMGIGAVTNGTAISLEQMVIDADIIKSIKNFADGIEMDNLEKAVDEIKAVEPGGNFMMAEQTMSILNEGKEYYYPETFNHSGTNAAGVVERAHKKVEEYLANWQSPVPENIITQLKELLL